MWKTPNKLIFNTIVSRNQETKLNNILLVIYQKSKRRRMIRYKCKNEMLWNKMYNKNIIYSSHIRENYKAKIKIVDQYTRKKNC